VTSSVAARSNTMPNTLAIAGDGRRRDLHVFGYLPDGRAFVRELADRQPLAVGKWCLLWHYAGLRSISRVMTLLQRAHS